MGVKIAVDLLWVRPKQVGGIEAYIRNLLDGFKEIDFDNEFWLLVSEDNKDSFKHYADNAQFHIHICNIKSSCVWKRIIWQNLYLGKEIKKLNVHSCFEPYYCKPFLGTRGIDFITTIHDLQAIHYPEYFSKCKVAWMKFCWWTTLKTSKKIIAISEYVKRDITSHYSVPEDKIKVIYNPISLNISDIENENYIEKKYGVKKNEYYFTVSSLLPHKNINTLIKVFFKIKRENINLPCHLIVSGVGGKSRESLEELIKKNDLTDNITLTQYIENSERNALYKYCRAFLFPSVFEGFGMPPIEAMFYGVPVITTNKTCIEEVTQGKANYVKNPYDEDEWIERMKTSIYRILDFSKYDKLEIAKKYLDEFIND